MALSDERVDVQIDEEPDEIVPVAVRAGVVGSYQILRRIGGGAQGAVYLARSIHPGRRDDAVAVKVLSLDAAENAGLIERCKAEAYLLSLLDHPNVVRTIESGIEARDVYIVMEYIDGPDLGSLLAGLRRRSVTLTSNVVSAIFDQVASALAYVHQARDGDGAAMNIVHRDLCPANVFVSRLGKVYVGDFGISAYGNARRDRLRAGHLGYAAPEQLAGDAIDARADVFAVAAILYALIAGRAPFDHKDAKASYAQIERGAWPPLPEAWASYAKFFERAFAVKPAKRFASVAELRDAFFSGPGGAQPASPAALAALAWATAGESSVIDEHPDGAVKEQSPSDVVLLSTHGYDVAQHDLIDAAGFRAIDLPSPRGVSRQTGVPVIIDLETIDADALTALQASRPPILVALAGPLSSDSLARGAGAESDVLLFQPYSPTQLKTAIAAELLGRLNARSAIATVAPKRVDRRRVLLIGLAHDLATELTARLTELAIDVDTCTGIDAAQKLGRERSHHLVVLGASDGDDSIIDAIAAFRAQAGYDVVPFLVHIGDVSVLKKLVQRLKGMPDAVHYLDHTITAHSAAKKVHTLVATAGRRAFRRYALGLDVTYTYLGVQAPGTLVDVSRLGALLRSDRFPHRGERIVLRVPVGGEALDVPSTVVHLRIDPGAGHASVGLDLAGLSRSEEARWLRFIAAAAEKP